MNDFSNFIKLINEFIIFFEELLPLEQEKLNASINNRVSFVEECMHKEQAAVLRLRGLEQKREKEQEQLGLAGCTFRQILEKVPEETASVLTPLFDRLSEQIRTLQAVNSNIKDSIEVNIHTIQNALADNTPGKDTYSASGRKNTNNTHNHFTSRSV